MDVCNLTSASSAFSKAGLNIWKFTVHVLLKPGLENFEHYFTSVWDECNSAVVWAFFGMAFLWDWNENGLFPVLWPLLSFPNLLAYWVQHFHSIIFRIWTSSIGIPSPPLALIVVMRPTWLHIPGCLALGEWSGCRWGYGFSSGHVWLWELDYKESWAPKNWCFWTVVLEKTLESPLDHKEIQSS